MSIETLQTLSKVSYILAVAFLLVSVLIFFLFHIPQTFNELTGRAAKKFIEEAKKKNEITEAEQANSFVGTSESLVSSDLLLSKSRNLITTNLEATTRLVSKIPAQEDLKKSPAAVDAEFAIIEEFSFTSSTEIIQ